MIKITTIRDTVNTIGLNKIQCYRYDKDMKIIRTEYINTIIDNEINEYFGKLYLGPTTIINIKEQDEYFHKYIIIDFSNNCSVICQYNK